MRTDDQAGGSESEALGEGLEVVDLPPLPVFDQAKRDKCIQSGDGMPLVFEWFKYLVLRGTLFGTVRVALFEVEQIGGVTQLAVG